MVPVSTVEEAVFEGDTGDEIIPNIQDTPEFKGETIPTGTTEEIDIVSSETQAEWDFCDKIRAYCTEHSIALVMKSLCEKVPEALPNYRTWAETEVVPIIHVLIQEPGYVEKSLPVLECMLTNNLGNISWTARVLIGMTIYKAVEVMVN